MGDASFIRLLYFSICSTLFLPCVSLPLFVSPLPPLFVVCSRVLSLGDRLTKRLCERDKHLQPCGNGSQHRLHHHHFIDWLS